MMKNSFVRFVLVGGANFLLDLGIFTLLANILGWDKIPANVVSVSVAMTFSFVMNYHFVWRSSKNLAQTIAGFFIVSIFSNYVVQNIVLSLVPMFIGEGETQNIIGKFCASFAGMITNYFGYKFVFTDRKK